MKFTHNAKIDYWESTAELFDRTVSIRLDTDYPEDERESVAQHGIEKVTKQWKKLQKVVADSLHKTYNQAWADPDAGLPRVSRKEFLATIKLRTVDVYEDGSLSLYFDDGGLFAGHAIDLFWTDDDKICKATLAG